MNDNLFNLVSEDLFNAFIEIRDSGDYNMFTDSNSVIHIINKVYKLPCDLNTYSIIIENFNTLNLYYGK